MQVQMMTNKKPADKRVSFFFFGESALIFLTIPEKDDAPFEKAPPTDFSILLRPRGFIFVKVPSAKKDKTFFGADFSDFFPFF